MSYDVTLGIEQENEELNAEISQELETQNGIIKSLNDDLNQANEEIRELKMHKAQLETLVLKKEENIIMLEKKINELNSVIKKPVWPYIKGKKDKQLSPVTHSTPNFQSKKGKIQTHSLLKHQIVHEEVDINNHYEVLEDGDDSVDEDSADEVEEKINTAHSVAKSTDKRNLLICADSHGRDLAWHLNAVQGTHEAVGFVRPGGLTEDILKVINVKEDNLSKSDTLVVVCGSNDVAKNEADNFLEILHKTLNETKDTNVVLVDLPIRYDLANWSCVNKEVVKTNKRLKELSEQFSNVSLVRASNAVRQLHTRHGQHLNHKGKRWLSNMIAETVASPQMGIKSSQGPKEDQPPAPGTESLLENYSLLETTVNI
ncbi:hypothetical protein J6590_102186 [Homalodisca vitripennis]|nr:hypothetical protein J6590_102186 [Homalodisca vitripennis]